MLSVAYKNLVGENRSSLRALNLDKESRYKHLRDGYIKKIKEELLANCNEILGLLDDTLIPHASDYNGRVFYLKMKGDYSRYVAE